MASLIHARCTCPAVWRGHGQRPPCQLHEAQDEAPAPAARIASLLAANRPGGTARDPEGMGAARSWRPWPWP